MNTTSDPHPNPHEEKHPEDGSGPRLPKPGRRFRWLAAAAILGKALALLALNACIQGPWDYYPENPPTFHGITVTGYAIAGRPVEHICFERMLDLSEENTEAFAFYDSADVKITGSFGGTVRTLALAPVADTPNCFQGDPASLVERGKAYDLVAAITWDSSGRKVGSKVTATAKVPTDFAIHRTAAAPSLAKTGGAPTIIFTAEFFAKLPPNVRQVMIKEYGDTLVKLQSDTTALNAYLKVNGAKIQERLIGLLKEDKFTYKEGDTLYYLTGALNTLSHYFSSDRSADVNGVLVTQRFDPNGARPETRFDSPLGLKPDSGRYYFPGDIRSLVGYPDAKNGNGWSVLDSIGVVNTWFHTGQNRLYFYAFEQAYLDFAATVIVSSPKVKPKFNVDGGQGVPDSFDVYIRVAPLTKSYSLPAVHAAFCREKSGWFRNQDCRGYYRSYCSSHAWIPGDCGQDAIQACLEADLNGNDTLKQACDSVAQKASKDTATLAAAVTRYCVAEGFPAKNGTCEVQKAQCQETIGINTCKQALWDYCLDNGWPHGQCDLGMVSYCRDKPRLSETLCRHADEYCRAHPGETLCK